MECCDMVFTGYAFIGAAIFFLVLFIGFHLEDKAIKDIQELVESEHEVRRTESEELMKKIRASLERIRNNTPTGL